jgi:hypothetical protein
MSLKTFFDNVIDNNVDAVQSYLYQNPGNKGAKQLSIVYAAAIGNSEMVKALLDHGINVNSMDVLTRFQRTWESSRLKRFQRLMEYTMSPFTRGWSPVLTPACVAAFYGHKNVLSVLCKHDFGCMSFNPYLSINSAFIGEGPPPSWNAATCALFGKKWDIASSLVDRGVKTTDMEEQYPLFLEFRTGVKIPKDAIDIVFSFLG